MLLQRSTLVTGQPAGSQVSRSQLLQPPHQIAQRLSSGKLAGQIANAQHVVHAQYAACRYQNVTRPATSNAVDLPALPFLENLSFCKASCLHTTGKLIFLRPAMPRLHVGPVQNGRMKPTMQQAEFVRKSHLQNGSTQPEAVQRPSGLQRSMAPPSQPRASQAPAPANRYSPTHLLSRPDILSLNCSATRDGRTVLPIICWATAGLLLLLLPAFL